ncbi:MAG: tripartite tricarboxylate transporter substrate binding protein [Betaproteobacteria bacterium]|nr:tripartite tricarboxylate transporter substrate binding protein [Betaproteobacteria bacterium]MBA3776097.1 tripartite tricarboxylate transporter substrate binding protein [Betaproteobacteria bacterium]
MKQRLAILGVVITCAGIIAPASTHTHAQTYPTKPVKLVVPYPPGGSADILGRAIGQRLAEQLGQPVVVENRPGAGTAVGTEFVARSQPDGYTLLLGTVSSHAMNPALSTKLGYDPIKDFAPIAPVATIPFVLVLHPSVPVQTVKEFVDHAKSRPGTINYSSAGNGTSNHLAGELFNLMAGINMTHVPYKGSAPALQDLIAGHVQAMFDLVPTSLPRVQAGNVKAIAVTSGSRVPSLPNVPTLKEAGYTDYEVTAWFGLFAPAGTPPVIVSRLHEETTKALASSELNAKLGSLGMETMQGSPQSFSRLVANDLDKWRGVVKAAKIQPE